MKCYKHYKRDSVAQCIDCGKALCPEFTSPICDQCELGRISNDKRLLIKNMIIMAILFLVGFSLNNTEPLSSRLLAGYFFAGILWGWSILSSITLRYFSDHASNWLVDLFPLQIIYSDVNWNVRNTLPDLSNRGVKPLALAMGI